MAVGYLRLSVAEPAELLCLPVTLPVGLLCFPVAEHCSAHCLVI